jgi:hypothetical protein
MIFSNCCNAFVEVKENTCVLDYICTACQQSCQYRIEANWETKKGDKKMKNFFVYLKNMEHPLDFKGKYLSQKETKNWHYYIDEDKNIYHFRKENITCIVESDIESD